MDPDQSIRANGDSCFKPYIEPCHGSESTLHLALCIFALQYVLWCDLWEEASLTICLGVCVCDHEVHDYTLIGCEVAMVLDEKW